MNDAEEITPALPSIGSSMGGATSFALINED
jgi:hypothetical protein